jgi:phosphoribosylanthranilate isomerase
VQVIAVVADMSQSEIVGLVASTGVDRVQLHGSEPPGLLEALGGLVYKALRVRGPEDVERARAYGGDPLLMDAFVPGKLGGTGHRFDWSLAAGLAGERRVLLAGGLDADNVADAVEAVRPWGVDVASGVELHGRPGVKDLERVAAFVSAARSSSAP